MMCTLHNKPRTGNRVEPSAHRFWAEGSDKRLSTQYLRPNIQPIYHKAINEKVRLYADVGNALIKAKEEAADPYTALEAVLPWETFVTSVQEARNLARPANFDYLDLLDDHYSHIRKYTPELLDTFTFHAAASSQPLAEALALVRDLGRKKVPENAPIDFVKPRWESHVVTDDGIDRHYYELCALSELRNGLGGFCISLRNEYTVSGGYAKTPLTSFETVIELISPTTTRQGLTVAALKDSNSYPTGIKVSDEDLATLNIRRDPFHGDWNLTIRPQELVPLFQCTKLFL
jgi:Rhodopirellula transposase DDE domain